MQQGPGARVSGSFFLPSLHRDVRPAIPIDLLPRLTLLTTYVHPLSRTKEQPERFKDLDSSTFDRALFQIKGPMRRSPGLVGFV
jgi:hypothetical protein